MRSILFVCFSFVLFSTHAETLGPNLYWPGDFSEGGKHWALDGQSPDTLSALEKENVLLLGTAESGKGLTVNTTQIMRDHDVAGKIVRISADVAYLTYLEPKQAWAGVLLVLRDGDGYEGDLLEPTPNPFWVPVSQSNPPGEFKTVSTEISIPAESEDLFFQVMIQPGVGANIASVRNIRMEIVGD